jgi:hypothetical protein
MLRYIFILFTLIPSLVHAADNAGAIKHFEDYLASCDTNGICCVWFLDDNPNVGMVMTFDVRGETVFTARDVYDWAIQSSETRRLTHSQTLSLTTIAEQMPPSDKTVEFDRAVSVSIRREGKVEIFHYDRRHAPAVIQRLYDIGGGYFYDGKTPNTALEPTPTAP